LTNEFSLKS